jgi:hypothetical protein
MPEGLEPLDELNPEVEECFFAEKSIRTVPIWAEDQAPVEPPAEPDCDAPISKAKMIESFRKIRDEAAERMLELEGASDVPRDPPSGGPTFGL